MLNSLASSCNLQVVTKHVHLELEVDFDARVLHGHVILSVERVEPTASTLMLDVSRLQIDSVQVDNCYLLQLLTFWPSGWDVWF